MLKYVFALGLIFVSWMSFSADYIAGTDYEVLSNKSSQARADGAIEVMEFFSFGCPWCYKLEPALDQWVKRQGSHIVLHKIPVVFNKDWALYAKAYYAVKALSLSSKLNPALFKAILVDKQPLNTEPLMIDFLSKNGMDSAVANSVFNHSTSIDMQLATSQSLMALYRINAVPAFVVQHQFKTDLQMAKTEQRLFDILDYLLKKTRHSAPKYFLDKT